MLAEFSAKADALKADTADTSARLAEDHTLNNVPRERGHPQLINYDIACHVCSMGTI